jgi:pilus assembly protein CpaE
VTPEVVRRVMDLLTGSYEYVVVDLPRQTDPCTLTVLDQADLVLIVCQLSVLSIGNAKRYMDVLTELGVPLERIEVVVNRHDGSRSLITVEDAQETIEKPVFAWVPNDFAFVSQLLDLGSPAAAFNANNPVRTAIEAMAQRIVGKVPAPLA